MPTENIWTEQNILRYEKQSNEAIFKAYRTVTLIPMFMYPSGFVLDWFTHRPEFALLASIRIVAALVCGFMYLLSRFDFVKNHAFYVLMVHFGLLSLGLTSMSLCLEGYKSPYYAGINLVVLVCGIILPKTKQMVAAILIIYGCYYVPVLIQARFHIDRPDLFINNSSFFVWTTILVLGCGWLKEQFQKESFARLLSLEQNQKELALAHGKLQEAEEQRSRFFANISHEFRTPLTLILEHSRKLLEFASTQKEKKSLELILSQSRLILRHVNDLLDIAKIEAGKQTLSLQKIDIAAHLRKTLEMFNVVAAERQIAFEVKTPESFFGTVDREKIERIALNLVSNAFKFCPNNSTIICTLSPQKDGARLVVEDNGPGVAAHMAEKIFDRFHQGEAVDTRLHGGTGLGLSIVKEFSELHGGRAFVEPSASGGARFVVELGLGRTGMQGLELPESRALVQEVNQSLYDELLYQLKKPEDKLLTPQGIGASGRERAKILVIEDNPDLNQYLANALMDDYQVATAFDGQEGLEKAHSLRPDLILCDMMMPRMSGSEVLAALRSDPDCKGIPVIILTAKADDDLRVKLLCSGADDYIMKPFVTEEVLARVKNLVSIKLSRDLLQKNLALTTDDLQTLSAEVIRQKNQLQSLCECLELAKDQAELSYRAKSRFLSLVSHEFRTPVAIFEMSLQLLKREKKSTLTDTEKREFDRASRAGDQLVQLVDTLLAYSQHENGDFKVTISQFEITETIGELADIYRPRASQKGLSLLVNAQVMRPIIIESDQKLFRLVLTNLIENALKYTPEGAVKISTELYPTGVVVAVEDSGIGIPEEKLHGIFDPFEQSYPTNSRKPPGLGLGLSLVKEVLSILGGTIELKSVTNRGSTFRIFLPYKVSGTKQAEA